MSYKYQQKTYIKHMLPQMHKKLTAPLETYLGRVDMPQNMFRQMLGTSRILSYGILKESLPYVRNPGHPDGILEILKESLRNRDGQDARTGRTDWTDGLDRNGQTDWTDGLDGFVTIYAVTTLGASRADVRLQRSCGDYSE